ncbi:MAG: hypothetical protein V3W41_14640 [Planctomycetota bacterium]
MKELRDAVAFNDRSCETTAAVAYEHANEIVEQKATALAHRWHHNVTNETNPHARAEIERCVAQLCDAFGIETP